MKPIYIFLALVLPVIGMAQDNSENKDKEVEQIIITKKGTAPDKMNITIDGEDILVDGKPVSKDKDADINVKRVKIKDFKVFRNDFNDAPLRRQMQVIQAPNKAMLGVMTEKNEQGLVIHNVSPKSAADAAGLTEGDIITNIDGKRLDSPDELSATIKDKKPGDVVRLDYLRDGKKQHTKATLKKWEGNRTMIFGGPEGMNGMQDFSAPNFEMNEVFKNLPRNFESGDMPRQFYNFNHTNDGPKLGIKVQELEKGTGVKVMGVQNGSDADEAGVKEGDIIKEINDDVVRNADHLIQVTRLAIRSDEPINLKIDRKGVTKNITIKITKKIQTADL